MITVEVEKQCGCFKRSDFKIENSFDTLEEAKTKAQNICDRMNEEFCLKHTFWPVVLDKNKIIIKMGLSELI